MLGPPGHDGPPGLDGQQVGIEQFTLFFKKVVPGIQYTAWYVLTMIILHIVHACI